MLFHEMLNQSILTMKYNKLTVKYIWRDSLSTLMYYPTGGEKRQGREMKSPLFQKQHKPETPMQDSLRTKRERKKNYPNVGIAKQLGI